MEQQRIKKFVIFKFTQFERNRLVSKLGIRQGGMHLSLGINLC